MEYSKIIRYLKGETSPIESKEVNEWKSIPENLASYKEIEQIWDASKEASHLKFNADTQKAWQKLNQDASNLSKNRSAFSIKKHYTKLAIAASFVILCCIGWFLTQQSDNTKVLQENWTTVVSNSNQIKKLNLPDGTKIWLNKNSRIKYSNTYNITNRKIELEGEAFFEVAHNKEKPFFVYTATSIIEVLGTSFNINTSGLTNEAEINVVTGKIAFSNKSNDNSKLFLTKGEKGLLTESNELIKSESDGNQNYLAWKTGNLRFDGTSLNEVCRILSKHYNRNIILENEDMNNLDLTVSFYDQSIEEALEVINLTLDTEYTINDTSIVLTK